jgi:hypothetical protein
VAGGCACSPNALTLVAAQVVEHGDHASFPEGRHELLLHPDTEQRTVDRTVKDTRRGVELSLQRLVRLLARQAARDAFAQRD